MTLEGAKFDGRLIALLHNFRITITREHLDRATARAKIFSDRGRVRSPEEKFIDALMEIAEVPLENIGAIRADIGQDVRCPGSIVPGVVEVKTVEKEVSSSKIVCSQAYDFMLILERENFTKKQLLETIKRDGVQSLVGLELNFTPREIFRFDRHTGGRNLYILLKSP